MSDPNRIFERLTTMDVQRELRARGLPISGTLQEQFDRFFNAWYQENGITISSSSSSDEEEVGTVAGAKHDTAASSSSEGKSAKPNVKGEADSKSTASKADKNTSGN